MSGCTATGRPRGRPVARGRVSAAAVVDHLDVGDELVALPVHGADDRLPGAVVADGLAHRLDPRRQRRLADEPVAPHLVEQLLLAHHLPR